jgi:hypothetical protein
MNEQRNLIEKRRHDNSSRMNRSMAGEVTSLWEFERSIQKIIRVVLSGGCQVLRQFSELENRGRLADRNASSAIDAYCRVNVELGGICKVGFIFPWMDAIDRANFHALLVFRATFSYDISHEVNLSGLRILALRARSPSGAIFRPNLYAETAESK